MHLPGLGGACAETRIATQRVFSKHRKLFQLTGIHIHTGRQVTARIANNPSFAHIRQTTIVAIDDGRHQAVCPCIDVGFGQTIRRIAIQLVAHHDQISICHRALSAAREWQIKCRKNLARIVCKLDVLGCQVGADQGIAEKSKCIARCLRETQAINFLF